MQAGRLSVPDEPVEPSYTSAIQPDAASMRIMTEARSPSRVTGGCPAAAERAS